MAINRLPTHSLLGLLVVLVIIAHASNASAVKNKPDAAKTAEDKREFLYRVPLVDKLPETVDDAARAKSVLEYLRWLHHRGQWSKKLQLAVHPGDGIITVHATEDLKVCYIASYPRRYIFSLPRAQPRHPYTRYRRSLVVRCVLLTTSTTTTTTTTTLLFSCI
jgi:hypothetical protein